MMFSLRNQKLKEILFLQDYGDNPQEWLNALSIKGHPGVDLNWGYLDPIYSFSDGTVIYVDNGTVVVLGDLEYSYAHMVDIVVKTGQKVRAGELLGKLDSQGQSLKEDWSHLHFGLREIQLNQVPTQLLKWNFPAFSPIKYTPINVDNGLEGYINPNKYCDLVIKRVFDAIKTFENMKQEYNNPLALRYSPFQAGQKNGFAYFNTYEDGEKAGLHQLTICANGKSKYYKPTMTTLDFCKVYAPSSDNNNPQAYAKFINDYCGFKGIEPISDWLLTEINWVKKYNDYRMKGIWTNNPLIRKLVYLWSLVFKNR